MRKSISWISATALGLSLLISGLTAQAWGPMPVTVDNTDLSNGGTTTITCTLPEGIGINGFDVTISYPENKLTKVDMQIGDLYDNAYLKTTKDKSGQVGIMIVNKEVITIGEDVLTVTFEAVNGAQGSAIVNVTGNCTKPDTSTEDFGQVFTIELPINSSTGTDTTEVPTVKPSATAAPTATAKPSTGAGAGSGTTATAAPTEAAATAAPTPASAATAAPAPTKTPEASAAPVTVVNFTDISSHWAKDSITRLAGFGYINGFDDNTFRPEENVTRAQFIKMLAEVKELDTSMSLDIFNDVSEDAWYAPYVTAAYANGIVQGDDDNNFNPDASITRQEMAVMCARAFGKTGGSVFDFADKAEIADWAADAVNALAAEKIITGFDEDNTFRPANNTTRAQAAVVIERLIN